MNRQHDNVAVSVIVPLFNKRDTVARAVQSVLNQAAGTTEVIVVDDGSTDGSVDRIPAGEPRVKVLRQTNAGPSAARNRGARVACNPVLLFLDADDEYGPGVLQEQIECRRTIPGLELSLVPFRVMEAGGKTIQRVEPLRNRQDVELAKGQAGLSTRFSMSLVTNVASGSVCIDRELFEKIGGFDEKLRCWEITDFLLRAQLATPSVYIGERGMLTVHSDARTSQFRAMHLQVDQLMRFGANLLASLPSVPADQHPKVFEQVSNIMHALVTEGAIAEFKTMMRLASAHGWPRAQSLALSILGKVPDRIAHFVARDIMKLTARA